MQSLATQRTNLQSDLSAAYARLVEHLTWLKLRETLDQDRGLMAALQQYMAAIVERGADAVDALPKRIRENTKAVAETIENNVRKLIIDEQPINPKYYEKMSELLDALIQQRKQDAVDYQKYLEEIVQLTKKVKNPAIGESYPKELNTPAKRALYDNLDKNEATSK
jgi:type I site-specific restriction-modification system R (restriction) subunit